MAAVLHPLLERQPHPFPRHEPLTEEGLEDKGLERDYLEVAGSVGR